MLDLKSGVSSVLVVLLWGVLPLDLDLLVGTEDLEVVGWVARAMEFSLLLELVVIGSLSLSLEELELAVGSLQTKRP